jgi:hypothetical protein
LAARNLSTHNFKVLHEAANENIYFNAAAFLFPQCIVGHALPTDTLLYEGKGGKAEMDYYQGLYNAHFPGEIYSWVAYEVLADVGWVHGPIMDKGLTHRHVRDGVKNCLKQKGLSDPHLWQKLGGISVATYENTIVYLVNQLVLRHIIGDASLSTKTVCPSSSPVRSE